MLDIGWSELVLIGVVALIFVGPKDLPRMFHALGRFTAKARGMAREFQRAMDDAAKSSGLDEVRKDLSGVSTGLKAATNPAGYGINALEDAARKFEKWDPKTVLKPAAAPVVAGPVVAAPVAAATSTASSAASSAAAVSSTAEAGPETQALAEKRAAEAAAARAKAHELQAKAAASASATFAARAKADAEAAAAKMADESAAAGPPKTRARARKAETVQTDADAAAQAAKPARKPPVRRKKSDA